MANDAAFVSLFCPQCGGGISATDEVIICPYCGTRLLRRVAPPAGDAPSTAETPGRPRLSQGIRFTPFTYTDPACGLEAFHLLIPSGWQVMGGVQWNYNNPAAPASIGFRVYNPGGPEAFEAFPNLGFFWTNEPMMRMYYPPGSLYNGSEVHEPLNAQQFFRQIFLPRARPVTGVQIVSEEHLPDLANRMHTYIPLNPRPPQMVVDGGCACATTAMARTWRRTSTARSRWCARPCRA
jgi:DNA-directed RNA polymerase subunit RPC12/RpoP